MFMVCGILGLCCIVNFTVCMFLIWLPYGVINYNKTVIIDGNVVSREPSYFAFPTTGYWCNALQYVV